MSLLTQGITVACTDESTRGGISQVWVANRDDITSFTAGTNHDYNAVTMTSTAKVFFEIEFFDFTAQHTSEGELGDSGSSIKTDTLEMFVPLREAVKAKAIQELFTSCKVVVIYKTFNSGKMFTLGYDEVLLSKAALRVNVSEDTGKALNEQNGYTITFTGMSGEVTREFIDTIPV